jgi:hypothetical protein
MRSAALEMYDGTPDIVIVRGGKDDLKPHWCCHWGFCGEVKVRHVGILTTVPGIP